MVQYVHHKADTRGLDHNGRLDSKKTFSFADYYNPKRMGFGALRVLNDDVLAGGKGFGSHPHDNMEIISIPLSGSLRHEDSLGNNAVVQAGQVQVISAGSGLFHSEYNHSASLPASFLQIWIYPAALNTKPRYTRTNLPLAEQQNKLYTFIRPGGSGHSIAVRPDTWMSMGIFDKGAQVRYPLQEEGNGLYAFVIAGEFAIEGKVLQTRDGLGILNSKAIAAQSLSDAASLLLIEVPMDLSTIL
ncbi:pirin family protein [Taibaiella helva]|uniref:pirin family protein n=1 Tax=Taibaiella helva TaxID=2301235 RepID=UPI000E571C83|nr:pirin family protein [Taibaiella helva]